MPVIRVEVPLGTPTDTQKTIRTAVKAAVLKESLNHPILAASRGRGSLDLKFGDVPDRLGAALVVGGGPNGRYPRRSASFPVVPPSAGRLLPCHPVA